MSRDPAVTSHIMSSIPNRDTSPELLLRRELHRRGLRYRLRSRLLGSPDLVFNKSRVAVFVDGDYWHGNTWRLRRASSFESYYGRGEQGDFWLRKIRKNVIRDTDVTARLSQQGWLVLRFWESDLIRDITSCATEVEAAVRRPGSRPLMGADQ